MEIKKAILLESSNINNGYVVLEKITGFRDFSSFVSDSSRMGSFDGSSIIIFNMVGKTEIKWEYGKYEKDDYEKDLAALKSLFEIKNVEDVIC